MPREHTTFAARIDPEVHRQAKTKAAAEGRTLQEVAEILLRLWIEGAVNLPPPSS